MKIKRQLSFWCVVCVVTLSLLLFGLSCAYLRLDEEEVEKKLPVYLVTKSGITQDKARMLGKALGINEKEINRKGFNNQTGLVTFIDSNRYLSVPTKKLGAGKLDERGNKTVVEAFDFGALKKIKVLNKNVAHSRFKEALTKAGINLTGAEARSSHSIFETFDTAGKQKLKIQLDTRVVYNQFINGIPITGPGAKISASFDGSGRVTRLRCAVREFRQGEFVPLLPEAKVKKRLIERYRQNFPKGRSKDIRLKTKLVYYAPSLSVKGVKALIPFYECSGTSGKGKDKVILLDELVPAVDSKKYVPEIHIDTGVKGAEITAGVDIKGGTPPYKINWTGADRLSDRSARQAIYMVKSRKPVRGDQEKVIIVTVTDANGITVKATRSLMIESRVIQQIQIPKVAKIGGIRDFGTENAVTNQFGDLEEGFVDEMLDDGVQMRFRWMGLAAWEQDFKALGDQQWIDNTDITFYVGHGDGDGFTFENNSHDDSKLDYNDADGDWGDKDLEWLALYSCQVLESDWGGMNRFDRWKQEFDGLHLLLGFQTNAQVRTNFSRAFAQNMVDVPMTVLDAWFEAIESDQPSDRVGVVMGVLRSADGATNWNDYFWSKGPVGPDIRGSDIGGYWTLTIY